MATKEEPMDKVCGLGSRFDSRLEAEFCLKSLNNEVLIINEVQDKFVIERCDYINYENEAEAQLCADKLNKLEKGADYQVAPKWLGLSTKFFVASAAIFNEMSPGMESEEYFW